MDKKDLKINEIEKRILKILIENNDYMTTQDVARKTKISWNTAFRYLNILHKRGWIERVGDTQLYWLAECEDSKKKK